MLKQFKFRNFRPTQDLEILANLTLFQSVDVVPNAMLGDAYISKVNDKYHCHLEVISKDEPFVARVISANPQKALKKLVSKLRGQVITWQNKNFVEPLFNLVKREDLELEVSI